jgi:uncharacterized membrane protein YfcA
MLLEYWFLLPVGIAIAFLAMSAGVSGAALWVPVYLLWLKLDVRMAFWLSLFTILFGFGSGCYRNWRDGAYDRQVVINYSLVSVPPAIIGGLLADKLNARFLVAAFGIFVFGYSIVIAISVFRRNQHSPRSSLVQYGLAALEGLFTGIISVGSGVLTIPALLREGSGEKRGEAVGSGVMIIFLTSIAATLARMKPPFVAELERGSAKLIAILLWAVPAVIIGGQLGPRLAQAMPSERYARLYLSGMLLVVALLTLIRAGAIS